MPPVSSQRGATLVVTLILFFAMTLTAAYANRNHVFEQRASANQVRSSQAFEAAEAGIEWAVAMLNDPHGVRAGPAGRVDAVASFRDRHLRADPATGEQRPVTWRRDGADVPLRAACVRRGGAWHCDCPSQGEPVLAPDADGNVTPAFSVAFATGPSARLVGLVALGCSDLDRPCAPDREPGAPGSARVQVTLGLIPGLATAPVAPLTTKDAVRASGAIGLHNVDAEVGGVALHAGGGLLAPHARITTSPGGPLSHAVAEGDDRLHALDGEQLFMSVFGLDKASWKQHPALARVECRGECSATMKQAVGPASAHRMVWVDGELQLDGPITLGAPERPVIVVAAGAVHLRGPVTVHGVVHGSRLTWNGAGAGAVVRGAALSEGGYEGDGAPDFVYDSGLLAALKTGTGSFARLPGSWRDF